MDAPSSISSSELADILIAEPTGPLPALRRVRSAWAVLARYCPASLLVAAGCGLLIHLALATVYVEPVARAGLRDKVRMLTRDRRPSLIIAGDSRIECGVIPDVLSSRLGLPRSEVINMAETACDTPAVVAAYREFAKRFASSPTLVVGVSVFGANDAATDIVGDELLWSLDFTERFRLAGLTRAICGCFLREKAAWGRLTHLWPSGTGDYPDSGFESVPGHLNVGIWSPAYLQARVQALAQWWYADPKLDGIRWNRLVGDLETLNRTGARLIVVFMPAHPAFIAGAHDTAAGRTERTFRMRVRGVCERLGVPCLDYGSDCLKPRNPDLLFHDLIHLNRDGAPAFSEVLARDLAPLLRKPA